MSEKSKLKRINAKGLGHKDLNEIINQAFDNGAKEVILDNVNGQRYIGCGLKRKVSIRVNGVPGNDLAAFMDGPTIIVNANAQDGIGNTMNGGKIIVHGDGGDIVGHSMRGGKIYIKGNAGYRVGIHMKSYQDSYPVVIIGGRVGDFLGEYMAGGILIILGLEGEEPIAGNFLGTGMHGGIICIRGEVKGYQLGKEVKPGKFSPEEWERLKTYLEEFSQDFSLSLQDILKKEFTVLFPHTTRPYGRIYAY